MAIILSLKISVNSAPKIAPTTKKEKSKAIMCTEKEKLMEDGTSLQYHPLGASGRAIFMHMLVNVSCSYGRREQAV